MIEKIIDCDLFFLLGFDLSLHWIPKIPTKERKRKWEKDREKKEKGGKKVCIGFQKSRHCPCRKVKVGSDLQNLMEKTRKWRGSIEKHRGGAGDGVQRPCLKTVPLPPLR
jgi:hypothetical protein